MESYKSIKCAYINCKNEAYGYKLGINHANWFCKKCGGEDGYKTLVSDVKDSTQSNVEFINGVVVEKVIDNTFTWDKFENALKHFDYTYMMSDMHSVWVSGRIREKEVRLMVDEARKLDSARTDKLISKYRSDYGTQF